MTAVTEQEKDVWEIFLVQLLWSMWCYGLQLLDSCPSFSSRHQMKDTFVKGCAQIKIVYDVNIHASSAIHNKCLPYYYIVKWAQNPGRFCAKPCPMQYYISLGGHNMKSKNQSANLDSLSTNTTSSSTEELCFQYINRQQWWMFLLTGISRSILL